MSKVKITGNASGTGIFTVAAPATNTDRTLTLPDVDATLLTNAGGTISGVTQISHPTETGYASNLAETVSKATLKIKTHSSDSTLTTFGAISGGDAYIQRSNGPGTGSYNIRLNPFGGAVVMPYQPAFAAYVNVNVSGGGTFPAGGVKFNSGGHYNASTYTFTAPVAGRYLFTAYDNFSGVSAAACYIRFMVNGAQQGSYIYASVTGGWVLVSGSEILYLNANDTVYAYYSSGHPDYGANWGLFSGMLLG